MGGIHTKELEEIEPQNHQLCLRENMAQMVSRLHDSSTDDLKNILQTLQIKALADALKTSKIEAVVQFINDGHVGINDKLGDPEVTPLHLAAQMGNSRVLKALIDFPEADLNAQDKDGDTPLMLAIYGAESDSKAVVICSPLVSDPRCDITKKNHKNVFPLLVSLRCRYKETTDLLISKTRLNAYSSSDLLASINVAMNYRQEQIAETIIERVHKSRWITIAGEMNNDPRMSGLKSLLQLQLKISSEDEAKQKSMSSHEELTTDAQGHVLKQGNTVKTLSIDALISDNPREMHLEFLQTIASQLATVLDISGPKIFIKAIDEKINVIGHVIAKGVVFVDEGPKQALADGTVVEIGSYVKVFADITTLKASTVGHGEWNEQMTETCGKTGRILDIDKDGDVKVQFAWGKFFFYNPQSLLPSDSENAETQDSSKNWLSKNSPAQVTSSKEVLKKLQKENHLPVDDTFLSLVGKYVSVLKSIITPYSLDKDIIVVNEKQTYKINASSLTLVTCTHDHQGQVIRVGSKIQMLSDQSQVVALQTEEFGKLTDSVGRILGEFGLVVQLLVNTKFDPSDVVVEVKFNNRDTKFYLNPKLLLLQKSGENEMASVGNTGPLTLVPSAVENAKSKSLPVRNEDLQLIARPDLKCKMSLGEGGFGCVNAGSWKGTECAIKRIKATVTSQISYDDIIKEAKIHFTLKHPNIVQLYGISYENDLWMVMQIIRGTNLFSVIFPDKTSVVPKLQVEQKLKIALQICNGINYIHEKGFLHGDIKPHNIMLESLTNNIYICDFGISRYLGEQDLHKFVTKYTNTFAGTMYYIAPECLKREKNGPRYLKPTFKADIWSIGVVLYELFTETLLFEDNILLAKCKYLNSNVHLKEKVLKLEMSVRHIVDQGLELDVEQRPTTNDMIDFFYDLTRTTM